MQRELAGHAARLVAVPRGEMGQDEWADVIASCQALVNGVTAVQTVAIARTAAFEVVESEDGTWEAVEQEAGHIALDGPSVVADRLGCTEMTAGQRATDAAMIVTDLPEVLDAMASGVVDGYRARRVCAELVEATPEVRRAVSAALRDDLGRLTAPRLADRCRAILGRIDEQLLRDRATRARASRGLFRGFGEPGVEEWRLVLPAEQAGPLWAAVDGPAQQAVRDGAADTIAQARSDALAGLVMQQTTGTWVVHLTTPAAGPATQSTSAARVAESAAAGHLSRAGAQVAVEGLAPASTDVPAEWLAERLLDAAANERVAFAPTHPVTGGLLPQDATTDAYRPTRAMAAAIRARDRRCRFPGCQVAARYCDLDHVRPWPAGQTHPDNLVCLCRRHHRIKQRRGWQVLLDADGVLHWTDPTGRRRSSAPPDITGVTLPRGLPALSGAPEPHTLPDPGCALRDAEADAASHLETAFVHRLIRSAGEVPDGHDDAVPDRRRDTHRRAMRRFWADQEQRTHPVRPELHRPPQLTVLVL